MSRVLAVAILLVGLVTSACSSIDPTGTMETASPIASAAPTATSAETPPSAPASATPEPASTTPAAAASPCPVERTEGVIPFDRLVDVEVVEGADADLVVFTFERSPTPPPQGPASGTLELAEPPFTHGASGLPIELRGERAVIVRFDGQTLATDEGEAIYDGPLEIRPELPALRDVVNFDLFEGVAGWYIGWDGPGCVTLLTSGDEVAVYFGHPG